MACAAASTAQAFFIPASAQPRPVVEFFNTLTGHYFMTADEAEMGDIEAGKAGPGWVRTGLAFNAYPPDVPNGGEHCGEAFGNPDFCGAHVFRFYGAAPNSHVFTADPAEAEILRRPGSGWAFERVEFRIPVPDAAGNCPAGSTPVVRLYNNRAMSNDANHRYVTREGERARLRAAGWIDEGARFCSIGTPPEVPIRSFELGHANPMRILPSAQCEDESVNLGACIAVNNLPLPNWPVPPKPTFDMPTAFFERTGMQSSHNFVRPELSSSADLAASGSFVQGAYSILGIHVETSGRGPSVFSSINPIYQFNTTVDAEGVDLRFRPFGIAAESDVQLSVSGTVNVKRLRVANPSSHAYGHATLEFTDARSGRNLYFTVAAYGTVPMGGDYLAPDVATGKVIVGTTLGGATAYGRGSGIPSLPTPSGFVAENSWGWGGPFDFRIDRAEFQRIVDAARGVDPALSRDPRDYIVDNFHFTNEVVGDGEIGLNLAGFKLQLLRR